MKYLLEAVTNTDTHTQEKYRHTKAHFSSAVASRTQFPVGPLTATAVAHSQDRDVSNSDDDADVSADDVSAAEKKTRAAAVMAEGTARTLPHRRIPASSAPPS